jgi:flap endonuclease-1
MGVEGGSINIISYKPEKVFYKKNKLMFAVIDASSIICRFAIGSLNSKTYIVDKDGQKVIELYFFFIIALRFLNDGIIPIFVFDGPNPKLKEETVDKRRHAKEKAHEIVREKLSEIKNN